ncbi:hypothetical protein F4677DRAFT_120303 [Hypoxylon crocopeplum]|nr:hypothetical protein F4677DRAFT_120303 [Hypoxylon crocopeplum]
MPAEVISLLSSSPEASPAPIRATSPVVSARTQAAPSRALTYGIPNFTEESSRKTSKQQSGQTPRESNTGVKRLNTGRTRQDDDFLFLSDDFDTTGDLEGNVAKKVCVSPKKRADSSFKRTQSAVVASNPRKPPSPTRLKRWNSIADPIENSSSPNRLATSKGYTKPNHNSSDPFNSPPKKRPSSTKPVLDLSSDPFRSSPRPGGNDYRPPIDSKAREVQSEDHFSSPKSKKSSKVPVFIDLSDDDFDDPPRNSLSKGSKPKAAAWDPISSSMPETKSRNNRFGDSDSESDDLPDLGDIDFSKLKSRRYSWSLSPSPPRKKARTAAPAPKSSAPRKSTEPKRTDEQKEEEKRKKAEAREAEKERKRVEKERAKEQRATEKQKEKALAEVNKLKTDRKVAVPEMIVDLPTTLSVGIKAQIEKLLDNMSVQFEYYQSRVDNAVKWRRKVTSKYDEELGHWEPVPMHIKPEEHVMVILEAAEFVKLVLAAEGQDLEAHILKMKTSFPEKTFIFLIEGLMPWMRKNKNILNRRFASAVRAALDTNADPSSSQPPRRRNNAQQQEYIDEDVIEDALLSLQVVHGALIHHTNAQVETAEWVAVFTQHISTIPYRRARDAAADAGFCMEAGQVRAGDDARDTYVRMLQEVARVTAPIAYGIAARYASVAELVRGLEADGPLALENCRKCANRDGAFTDRVVGQAVSKRVYKIFTGRDPGSMDV